MELRMSRKIGRKQMAIAAAFMAVCVFGFDESLAIGAGPGGAKIVRNEFVASQDLPQNCPQDAVSQNVEQPTPLPYAAYPSWAPDGMRQPWPEDEYLRDGGDEGVGATVGKQGEAHGVEAEDTVGHFDTVEGRTIVQPSNPTYIYSPRFCSVRKVVGLVSNEQSEGLRAEGSKAKIAAPRTTEFISTTKQRVQANNEIAAIPAHAFRMRQGDGAVSSVIGPRGFQDAFKAYENIAVIRQGFVESSDAPMLARGAQAAVAWESKQAVQVILDKSGPMEVVKDDKFEGVYVVNEPPATPRMQVVKVASTPFANSGETVEFTIRFDNVGNQVIGNVTIVDSLSSRLEYVPNSAQCSREAKFYTEENEKGSLVVRCDVHAPVQPGEGGVVRFRCKVR